LFCYKLHNEFVFYQDNMPWDINRIPECHDLPRPVEVYGRQAHAHVIGGVDRNGTGLLWWAFSFESVSIVMFIV
jgi:hypothetical protein